jgi:dynein heavy chain
MDEFKPKVPLLVALRNRGMNERHWTAISNKAGKEVKPSN